MLDKCGLQVSLYDCGVIILEHSGACLFLCGNVDFWWWGAKGVVDHSVTWR